MTSAAEGSWLRSTGISTVMVSGPSPGGPWVAALLGINVLGLRHGGRGQEGAPAGPRPCRLPPAACVFQQKRFRDRLRQPLHALLPAHHAFVKFPFSNTTYSSEVQQKGFPLLQGPRFNPRHMRERAEPETLPGQTETVRGSRRRFPMSAYVQSYQACCFKGGSRSFLACRRSP